MQTLKNKLQKTGKDQIAKYVYTTLLAFTFLIKISSKIDVSNYILLFPDSVSLTIFSSCKRKMIFSGDHLKCDLKWPVNKFKTILKGRGCCFDLSKYGVVV